MIWFFDIYFMNLVDILKKVKVFCCFFVDFGAIQKDFEDEYNEDDFVEEVIFEVVDFEFEEKFLVCR